LPQVLHEATTFLPQALFIFPGHRGGTGEGGKAVRALPCQIFQHSHRFFLLCILFFQFMYLAYCCPSLSEHIALAQQYLKLCSVVESSIFAVSAQ
jgi:hypothetical protein